MAHSCTSPACTNDMHENLSVSCNDFTKDFYKVSKSILIYDVINLFIIDYIITNKINDVFIF